MRVIRSEFAGACYGVERAIGLALQAVKNGDTAKTLGPLIHNPQVVRDLEHHGITSVNEPSDILEGKAIIRSHGVSPSVKAQLVNQGLEVIDATCPYVRRAQNAAAELARKHDVVIVVGADGHPEVEGLKSYAVHEGASVVVLSNASDIPDGLPHHVGVVVQTTQTIKVLDAVLAGLTERGIEIEVADTVCSATEERQQAAADLSQRVDAMVVIGGYNSANTTHLAEICADLCPNTHHIETVDNLDSIWFKGCSSVGVTAGASTPDVFIEDVIEALRGF